MGYIKMSAFKRVLALLADSYLTGYQDGENIRIRYADFFQQLGLDAGGASGTPIRFEGNQLPSTNNTGGELVTGDWTFLEAGETYTNINGGEAVEAPESILSIAIFDDTDGVWRLQELATIPGKDPIPIWDLDSENPLSGQAIKLGFSKFFQGGEYMIPSADDVKELNERVQFYDRPDLKYQHYLVDKDKKIFDRLLSEKFDGGRFFPEGFEMYPIDRPDLGAIILIDAEGKYLGDSGSSSGSGGVTPDRAHTNVPFYNPPEQESFFIGVAGNDTIIGNYDTLISAYDEIMSHGNLNPNIPAYVTKESIGVSGVDDIPIYKYSFTPPNPRAKILLVAGEHAVEKMYIFALHSFMKELVYNWDSHPFLELLRWGVQIDVLPCRCPYANSNPTRRRGTRTTPETAPIPFSWIKADGVVTLTFDPSNFPSVPDNGVSGDDYFTASPSSALVNRLCLGVMSSSDEVILPRSAYRISSVINGQSVQFPADGANGSGTGTFQVWTDPNRNMSFENTSGWDSYNSGSTIQSGDNGITYTAMGNKGTKPFSLIENRNFIRLIESENYDYVLSGHSPGGDNYLSFNPSSGFVPNIAQMLAESGAFVNTTNRILDRTGDSIPWTVSVVTLRYNTPMHTPEWGSGLDRATEAQVRDALRWMTITIKDALTKILNR